MKKNVKYNAMIINFCFLSILLAMFSVSVPVNAYAEADHHRIDVQTFINEFFRKKDVNITRNLYGFDDKADYVYVEFVDSGYAVFYTKTMEMLEYSLSGNISLPNAKDRCYYAGPLNYYSKKGETYVNTSTGSRLDLSKEEAASYARRISKQFLEKTDAYQDYSISEKISDNTEAKGGLHRSVVPSFDQNNLISAGNLGSYGTTYIPNAYYFINGNPTFGHNIHGTCGSSAVQLILSYNNYYNDRRIISPQYLNGGWTNLTGNDNIFDANNYTDVLKNPNVCPDPLSTENDVLGSKEGYYTYNYDIDETIYITDPTSYYYQIISALEPNALSCICTKTKKEVQNGITTIITTTYNEHDNIYQKNIVTRPSETGEQDEEYTLHTHTGANTSAVVNGLSNVLGLNMNSDQYSINYGYSASGPCSSASIKGEVDNGRPLIIGMKASLGGVDHWVVGYGYEDYTYPSGGSTYSGYIVNCGWHDGDNNVWINESWCNSYITLEMKHVHNYINNPNPDKDKEMKCTECEHRNVRFLYDSDTITGIATGVKNNYTCPVSVPTKIDGHYVNEVGVSAFASGAITWENIVLPKTVYSIGSGAFAGLGYLKTLNITSSTNLVSVPDFTAAFTNGTYMQQCLGVDLEPNVAYTFSFSYYSLSTTGSLSDVTVELGVGTSTNYVTPITSAPYTSNTGLQTLYFIPSYTQLSANKKLWCRFVKTSSQATVSVGIKNVILEKGVTEIAIDAFRGCYQLATPGLQYTMPTGSTECLVSQGTMNSCALFIPHFKPNSNRTITAISDDGFANNNNIRWVFTQVGLTSIGDRAFQYCGNLVSVDMKNTSVVTIGDNAFDICKINDPNHVHNPHSINDTRCMIEAIRFPDNSSLLHIGNSAFIRTGIPVSQDDWLPDSVQTIGNYAFAYSIRAGFALPNGLRTIGDYAFANASCSSFSYSSNCVLETIGSHAFEGATMSLCKALPRTVKTIGAYAFNGTHLSSDFSISGNNQLLTIGNYAFQNAGVKFAVLPGSLTGIGSYAFNSNSNLTFYCQAGSKPNGWNNNWNNSNRPVFWSCSLSSSYPYYVTSFTKSANNPSNTGATNGITDPVRDGYNFGGWYTTSDYSGTQYTSSNITSAPNGVLYAKWTEKSCVAEGTLITLADGTQVAVEDLTGNENLLVWNMLTGQYDSAPILFIDSDPTAEYEVITLTFSDNTEVKVIDEHAFFDLTLGKYVFLRDDAAQYIGHYFNKQGIGGAWTSVQLTSVSINVEITSTWSPVTYGHLCYYVNGMLSMPGATEGFINIFDVDTALMAYDATEMESDIATYGLYTYEEFNAIVPLPELVFNAFNGQYLKVSIGKGLITVPEIAALLERYAGFFI